MKKLKVTGMVRINGEKVPQESIPPDLFHEIVEEKMDDTMKDLCFKRIKTA